MKALTITIMLSVFCIAQTITAPPGKYFLILKFNQSMDTVTLKNKANYKVFDQNMNELPVLNIATMYYPNNGICADSSILLLVSAPNYKTNYIVRVNNVKSKAGKLINPASNSMWYYFDGFDPTQIKPYLIIKP